MNKSQKQYVKGVLLKDGRITRNHCLSVYISRLGAIICDLNKENGWNIEGHRKGTDYEYVLLNSPKVPQYVFDEEKRVMRII